MSFRFIDLRLWILMCVLLSICLIYTGIKRRKIDKKVLLATYFTVSLIGLLAALYRLIDEVFGQFRRYDKYILYVIIGLLAATFLEIVYLGITHKGNERSKRLIKIAFLITLISSIPLVTLIILDMIGVTK